VTIYLRAISTSNGRILKTINTTKTILSQQVDAGIFRYVSLKRLLEAEVGFTFNEPTGIAVQEAIDKAVYALVIEGILDDLWSVKNLDDLSSGAVASYKEEKARNAKTDFLGFETLPYRSRISLGVHAGSFIYDGDYPNSAIRPMGEISVGFFQNSRFSFDVGIGSGQLATRDYFSSIVQFTRLSAKYRFYNHYKYSPYIQLGGGYLLNTGETPFDYETHFSDGNFGFLGGDLGYEIMPTQRFGIDISAGYHWIFSDLIDDMEQGKYNDFFWSAKIGVNFYIGK
jgi:curli production assembly/transport component CsgG